MKLGFFIFALAFLVACETTEPTKPAQGARPGSQGSTQTTKLSRDAKVHVLCEADDLLYTTVLVGDAGVKPFLRRIEKYLMKNLNDRGITALAGDSWSNGEAKVVVMVSTLETVTKTDIGFWSPIVKNQPRVKYTATLTPGAGAKLFSFDGDQDDESIDNLAKKVAERVGYMVAKYRK